MPRPGLPTPDSEACSSLLETLTLAAAGGSGGADAAEAFVAAGFRCWVAGIRASGGRNSAHGGMVPGVQCLRPHARCLVASNLHGCAPTVWRLEWPCIRRAAEPRRLQAALRTHRRSLGGCRRRWGARSRVGVPRSRVAEAGHGRSLGQGTSKEAGPSDVVE